MTRTIRVNRRWALKTSNDLGGIAPFAEKLQIDRSTAYRQLSGSEAGPRFIAAVLSTFPVMFDDAFDVIDDTEEDAA